MLREELFINSLDKVQLKRIYIAEEAKNDDNKEYLIKDLTTDAEYEEVVVLPTVSINNFQEIIKNRE